MLCDYPLLNTSFWVVGEALLVPSLFVLLAYPLATALVYIARAHDILSSPALPDIRIILQFISLWLFWNLTISLTSLYFDEKRDDIVPGGSRFQILSQNGYGGCEHVSIIVELGSRYITHITPTSTTSKGIAANMSYLIDMGVDLSVCECIHLLAIDTL